MKAGHAQWRWPLVLGVASVIGLVVALLGEGGAWWLLAWLLVSLPLIVSAWHIWRPKQTITRER